MTTEIQPTCLDNCTTWPIIDAELDRQLETAVGRLDRAKLQERVQHEQTHESDGPEIDFGTVDDVEFGARLAFLRIGSKRTEMRERAVGCNGQTCALAQYCVHQAIAEELSSPLS